MSLVRRALHACQRLVPDAEGGLTILGYHLVGAGTRSSIDLPLAVFRSQMEELRGLADVVHLEEALARLDDGAAADRGLVVLTFDDGYENFFTRVLPVLAELQLPATLYVQVDFLSDDAAGGPISNVGRLPPLSWGQLRELAATGLINVGSHTCSHPDLRTVAGPQLERELGTSRAILEQRLGRTVDSFCYPRGQWSPRVEASVVRHYRTSVIRGGRTMRPGRISLHRLERVPIRRDMPTSLRPVVRGSVWLEEWLASKVRNLIA